MRVVRLSALNADCPYPPGDILGTHFCWKMSRPLDHTAARRINWMKHSIDTIGNLTPDSPARRRVPQLTAIPQLHINYSVKLKVKWSRYRPGVAQRVGRGITLLFHDRGTRRGWVVSSKPRPHFISGKDSVPILQEAGWVSEPVWTGGNLVPTGIRSLTVQPVAQSLYRLSYSAHIQ